MAAVCLVRYLRVGQTVPWLLSCGHFFSSPALGLLLSWRPPLARSVRKGTNRANLTLPLVGTNRRPFLSPFSCTFLRQETYPPRAPAHPFIGKQKERRSVNSHAPSLFLFFISPGLKKKQFRENLSASTPTPTPLFVRGLSPGFICP